MRSWPQVVLLGCLLACGRGEPSAPGGPSGPGGPPEPRRPGAPPSGAILQVAITEAADAAITVDEGGGWRLWPTLDGTRPPVVLHASVPRRVVLGRDGAGLVAGVLDGVGAIELIRTTRDGVVSERAWLPAEAGFIDLVAVGGAFGGGILALGRDQVVTWHDARGAVRGRLVPLPGELLVEVTARRGVALVGIGKVGGPAIAVRLLEVRDGALRWGAYTHLPDPLRHLALAPDHRRVAGIRAGVRGLGHVIELGGPKILEDDLRAGAHDAPAAVGFLSEGPAVMAGAAEIRRGPGDVESLEPGATSLAAFGDGLAVLGLGEGLALVDRARTRYLGYREVGAGALMPVGAHFAMEVGGQLLWLDRELAAQRATSEPQRDPGCYLCLALDERLFVEVARARRSALDPDAGMAPLEVSIGDPASGALGTLGAWPRVDDVRFEPRSRVLAISTEGQAHRFIVGPRGTATPLPPLSLAGDQAAVYPLDPGAARGAVAVAIQAHVRGERTELAIEVHRERGTPRRAVAAGAVLGVDESGTVWLADGRTVVALRDGAPVLRAELDLAGRIEDGAPSRDGAFAAIRGANEVIAIDARGAVRWRRELLRTQHLAVSDDGRTIAVATPAGVSVLDAATGERRAWACGWHFGLHDRLVSQSGAECRPD